MYRLKDGSGSLDDTAFGTVDPPQRRDSQRCRGPGLLPRTSPCPGSESRCLPDQFQEHFLINPEVPERPEESQERAQQYGYYWMIFGKKVLMGNLVFILKLLTMIFLR